MCLYLYCGNNPIIFVDPHGELPEWAWRLLASAPTAPQGATDFVAGMGDNLSFGATKLIRKAGGFDSEVNSDSGFYTAGEWSGTALSTAIGAGGGLKAAGSKALQKQANKGISKLAYNKRVLKQVDFSHWIPDRYLQKTGSNFIRNTFGRSRLNGNFVNKTFHAATDPAAYRWMPKAWKTANPMMNSAARQFHRIPNVLKGAAAGMGYSMMSMEANEQIDSYK